MSLVSREVSLVVAGAHTKVLPTQETKSEINIKMIYTTERQRADKEIDNLKSIIKSLSLNYLWTESSYSISINLKKSYINDYSKGSATGIALSTSTPKHFSPQHNSSDINASADSGIERESVLVKTLQSQ